VKRIACVEGHEKNLKQSSAIPSFSLCTIIIDFLNWKGSWKENLLSRCKVYKKIGKLLARIRFYKHVVL